MTDRKFVLTRVSAGDYLLPSNDGRTLWRITTYEEYGDAELLDGTTLRGTFWQTWKYNQPFGLDGEMRVDFLDWEYWETWATTFSTRAAAIEDCLRERCPA